MKQLFQKFIGNNSGAAAALGAILLPTIIGSAGLAVDGTRYMRAKQIVISAADQAALSAAAVDVRGTGQSREVIAANFFKANLPTEYKDIVDLKNFVFKDDSQTTGGVTINYTVNASVKPLIASAIGIESLAIVHEGTAVRDITSIEVVLALPMSGTMCSTKVRTKSPPFAVKDDVFLDLREDPSCKHFKAMKEGVQSFSDLMFTNQSVSKLKLGIVPYNVVVNMPDNRNVPPQFLQNETERNFYQTRVVDSDEKATVLTPVLPLTNNRDKVNAKIRDLVLTPKASAWSRTNMPTLTAALMLDPDHQSYFGNDVRPEDFDNKGVKKVLILMTDGSNIGCCFTNWKEGNFNNNYVYHHTPDNEQQAAYCETLKKHNVTIFTILFDVSENDKGGKEMNNLFARCASGAYSEVGVKEENPSAELKCSKKQNCYNISNNDQLKNAYKDIAQNFFVSRTSK